MLQENTDHELTACWPPVGPKYLNVSDDDDESCAAG